MCFLLPGENGWGSDRDGITNREFIIYLDPEMSQSQTSQQIVYLARHGETAWSLSGQHTGLTDIPLTEKGEKAARLLGERLKRLSVKEVWTSPLQRASKTSAIAGFRATPVPDLVEWNYGKYEGMIKADILKENPGWSIFRDGCPGGESVKNVEDRVERVIRKIRSVQGDVLLFAHGHILRSLASRWLGLELTFGNYLALNTASLSILGYDRGIDHPVLRLWNDESHMENM